MFKSSEKETIDLVVIFIWEHGRECLKVFIEQVNMFHSARNLLWNTQNRN